MAKIEPFPLPPGNQFTMSYRPPTEKDKPKTQLWIDANANPWTCYLNKGSGNWEKK
jgi:hypothetical protein